MSWKSGTVLHSELGQPNSTDSLSKTFWHNFQELLYLFEYNSQNFVPIFDQNLRVCNIHKDCSEMCF